MNLSRISDEFGPDDTAAVFEIVQQIVADVAGVDKSAIATETSFMVDLGF